MKKPRKPKHLTTRQLILLIGRVGSIYGLIGYIDDGMISVAQQRVFAKATRYFTWWASRLSREDRADHAGIVEKAARAMFARLDYESDDRDIGRFLDQFADALSAFAQGKTASKITIPEFAHFTDAILVLLAKQKS